ncbi:MAG: type II secretion system F family protein [Clostridiaceae bacterium]|nr:type II secretion system F family protein [Clostridiaceae bacterium]
MGGIVFLAAVTVFLTLLASLAGVGRRLDCTEKRLRQISEKEKQYSDEELKKPFTERIIKPTIAKLRALLSKASRKQAKNTKANRGMEKLDRTLKSGGIQLNASEFTMIKNVATVIALISGILAFQLVNTQLIIRFFLLILPMYLCILIPRFWLASRVKRRKEQILRELPDVMDLLVVSVEAGLGFDAAIKRLSTKSRAVVLTELMGAVKDVQMGVSRKISMKEMADRCDVRELTTFVTALIQAEQLGVSMKTVLVAQADRVREERRQRVKEKAQKAPIKMMMPTVMFIFPVMFIILLGPAVMSIIAAFS